MKKQTKKKNGWNIFWVILTIILLAMLALVILFKMDLYTPQWLNFLSPIQMEELVPSPSVPLLTSCSQVCSGFDNNYVFISECKIGETKMIYGYPNQPAILTCCCYDNAIIPDSSPCTDTDSGLKEYIAGSVVDKGVQYNDNCKSDFVVNEYYCDDLGMMSLASLPCDNGCAGGACQTTAIECHDSDSGLVDLEDKITTTGTCHDKNQIITDACDGDGVREYVCEPTSSAPINQLCGYTTYNCPAYFPGSHCSNGKCTY